MLPLGCILTQPIVKASIAFPELLRASINVVHLMHIKIPHSTPTRFDVLRDLQGSCYLQSCTTYLLLEYHVPGIKHLVLAIWFLARYTWLKYHAPGPGFGQVPVLGYQVPGSAIRYTAEPSFLVRAPTTHSAHKSTGRGLIWYLRSIDELTKKCICCLGVNLNFC